MKQVAVFMLLLFTSSAVAFAHAGEEHTYLGTITKINKDGSFVMKMTNGKNRTVLVSKTTAYLHSDGHKARASELVIGKRVSVRISKDGKTALNVKFSRAKKAAAKK